MEKKYELCISGLTQHGFMKLLKSIKLFNTVTAFCFDKNGDSFIKFETFDIRYTLKEI